MELFEQMCQWLRNNEVMYTTEGVKEIKRVWEKNKKDLFDHFRIHPNWNEDAKAIIFKEVEYERAFNINAVKSFNRWAKIEMEKMLGEFDLEDKYEDLNSKKRELEYAIDVVGRKHIKHIPLLINGEPAIYVLKEMLKEISKEYEDMQNNTMDIWGLRVENEKAIKFKEALRALRECEVADSNITTKELADKVNGHIPEIKAVEGQKLSRIIQKICKTVDLDKVVKINNYETYTRDDGYNREYAMLCNEINPVYYKRITVISLNPIDYWSMSHGKNWHSCHYVGNGDDGCYSSGTESYMLDDCSVIYYVIDEKYDGEDYCLQKKINRCVFCIGENGNAILECRVYPDDRDGGDASLSRQFRDVMSLVVSQIYNVNNYWNIKKGSSACKEVTEDFGTHYRDYWEYESGVIMTNASYNKPVLIQVGHDPICPYCGEEHNETENVVCPDCRDERMITCERCGDRVNEDEAIITSSGNYYCCETCANNDGYYYCEDTNEYEDEDDMHMCDDGYFHLEDYCYQDDYDGDWYVGDAYITTEDGHNYASEENAEADGYVETNFGYWEKEDECFEEDGIWYDKDDGIEMDDGEYFNDEDSAYEHGYVETEDGCWIKEDEAVYLEEFDIYYSTPEEAEEAGYVLVDGEWKEKESEEIA